MKLLWVIGIGSMFVIMPAAAHGGHAEGLYGLHLLIHALTTQGGAFYPFIFICIAGVSALLKSGNRTKR